MPSIVFSTLPKTLEDLQAMPQAAMSTPFDTAAMTVAALSLYPENKDVSIAMLDFLRGPRPMNGIDRQFLADRFREYPYVVRSYFSGSSPDNEYTPAEPYTVVITEGPYSYTTQGMAKLFVACSGADSPRPIQLRLAKNGAWYLWQQSLLVGIRLPASKDPWA